MCQGMKNTPGKPCCQCAGCVINRIDVEFAVPEPGEPGASIGSWGWDVTTQPATERVSQSVLGTTRTVCRQTYVAPTSFACSGSSLDFAFNTHFKILERAITGDYYANLLVGRFLFTGDFVYRVYAYVQGLQLRVDRWGTLARTVLSGTFSLTRERHHSGNRLQFGFGSCGIVEDVDMEPPTEHDPCLRNAGDPSCGEDFFAPRRTYLSPSLYAINMDSGWVEGDCLTLPTEPSNDPDIFGGYNSSAAAGTCRVPSGSTLTMGAMDLIDCAGYPNQYYFHALTYTADDVWFARHPFTIS